MEIKGKVAIVTGGASGLGAATIKRLHSLGAKVIIADMDEKKGSALAKELGPNAAFAKVDVTNEKEVKAAVDFAMEKFGKIHILVNCAGIPFAMKTVGKEGPHNLDAYKRVIAINLVGTFDMLRQAAFHMQNNEPNEDGERGVIINTASAAAFDGQIGQAAYAASKAGVVGMTLVIARDMSRSGIRCCTIAPGLFETPMTEVLPPQIKANLEQQMPFPKRLGKAFEYAGLAQQIIENSMLNGETIRLDGAVRMPAS